MAFTVNDLLDPETGETNLAVLKSLARRRAVQDYGAITPRSLRQALRYFGGMIPERQAAWRQSHGIAVETSMVSAYGKEVSGLRRSAF